jgi:ABC-2 type transport system ATP-binding protein
MGVLWATHLVDEAEGAHRVVVLHQGRLLAEGTPAELTRKAGKTILADAFIDMTGRTGDRRQAKEET